MPNMNNGVKSRAAAMKWFSRKEKKERQACGPQNAARKLIRRHENTNYDFWEKYTLRKKKDSQETKKGGALKRRILWWTSRGVRRKPGESLDCSGESDSPSAGRDGRIGD